MLYIINVLYKYLINVYMTHLIGSTWDLTLRSMANVNTEHQRAPSALVEMRHWSTETLLNICKTD